MTFYSPIEVLLALEEEARQKKKKKKLKRCAHCGSKAKMCHSDFTNTYFVECKGCGISTRDYVSKKDARKAWNKRKVKE